MLVSPLLYYHSATNGFNTFNTERERERKKREGVMIGTIFIIITREKQENSAKLPDNARYSF